MTQKIGFDNVTSSFNYKIITLAVRLHTRIKHDLFSSVAVISKKSLIDLVSRVYVENIIYWFPLAFITDLICT